MPSTTIVVNHKDHQTTIQLFSSQISRINLGSTIWSRYSKDGQGLKKCSSHVGWTGGREDLGSWGYLKGKRGATREWAWSNLYWQHETTC